MQRRWLSDQHTSIFNLFRRINLIAPDIPVSFPNVPAR